MSKTGTKSVSSLQRLVEQTSAKARTAESTPCTRRRRCWGTLLALCILAGSPVGMANEESEKWFYEWADTIQLVTLRCDFKTKVGPPDEAQEVIRGHWEVRVSPLLAQRLTFERGPRGEAVHRESLSWDVEKGEGRVFQRPPGILRGNGTRTITRPKAFGRVELPSDSFFYFRHDRLLPRFLRTMKVEVRPIGTSSTRVVAFVHRDESSILLAYVLDRALAQPLVELRAYIPEPNRPIEQQQDLGEDELELPTKFADHRLFVKKIVLESTLVKGQQLPTKWIVLHCLRQKDATVTVELVADSIQIDTAEPEEGYGVQWPPGTRVYDYGLGGSYWVGESGERLDKDVIRESDLDKILAAAGAETMSAGTANRDRLQPTGCAANALYVALGLLGKPRPLEELSADLGITSGKPDSNLADIQRAVQNSGLECAVVEGSTDLLTHATNAPFVLHALRGTSGSKTAGPKVGHFVLVDDYDEATGTLRVIDPPLLPYRSTLEQVNEAWTGKAVVLGADSVQATVGRARRVGTFRVLAVALGTSLLILGFFWRGRRPCRKQLRSTPCYS